MARVLLVDDEPSVRAALKELVQGRGWEPLVARSGPEALDLVDRADAVVTDFSMPGMDGLELLRAIRERDETLPVILLTARGSERLAVRAIKAGAYEYVPKPFDVHGKLLRALQDGEIQPVGSGHVEHVDVRIVACTNRDLAAEVRAGRFREDLYYRLAVVELLVPPLRDRREDIPALAHEFAVRYAERFGAEEVRLAPALVERLASAEWPGNVRQLENVMARAVALSGGGDLGPESFAETGSLEAARRRADDDSDGDRGDDSHTLRERLDALERSVIAKTMTAVGGNQSEAARRLGISRNTLTERLRRYELAPDFGAGTAR